MTDGHKKAIADARRKTRAIKAYLGVLAAPKPDRPVTAESITKKIATLTGLIEAETNSLTKLALIQQRLDAEAALTTLGESTDLDGPQAAFIAEAATYSKRTGITYSAWRAVGVPASVLRQAQHGTDLAWLNSGHQRRPRLVPDRR